MQVLHNYAHGASDLYFVDDEEEEEDSEADFFHSKPTTVAPSPAPALALTVASEAQLGPFQAVAEEQAPDKQANQSSPPAKLTKGQSLVDLTSPIRQFSLKYEVESTSPPAPAEVTPNGSMHSVPSSEDASPRTAFPPPPIDINTSASKTSPSRLQKQQDGSAGLSFQSNQTTSTSSQQQQQQQSGPGPLAEAVEAGSAASPVINPTYSPRPSPSRPSIARVSRPHSTLGHRKPSSSQQRFSTTGNRGNAKDAAASNRAQDNWTKAREAVFDGRVSKLLLSRKYSVVTSTFKQLFPEDFDRAIPVISHKRLDQLLYKLDFQMGKFTVVS